MKIEKKQHLTTEKENDATIENTQIWNFSPESGTEADLSENRYERIKTLGEGGMGLVELARDSILKREVALKTIKLGTLERYRSHKKQQMMLWRLNKEAEITALLEHPNIVPLYDLQKKKNGEIYFTMRKVQGETLSNLLSKKKNDEIVLDQEQLLTIFAKVCDAISYAHYEGVLHRDLKPDNIMVGKFGEVYVMDWGIAKRLISKETKPFPVENEHTRESDLEEEAGRKTTLYTGKNKEFHTVGGIGTLGYMAPEQSNNSEEVKEQADIYSLGIILKQCFTLLSPVEELKKIIELNLKNSLKTPQGELQTSLHTKNPIPEEINAIIQKATKPDWKERYLSVQDFLADIERYRKNLRVFAKNYSLLEIGTKWIKRNKKKVALAVVFLLLFLSFWGYLTYQKKKEFQANFALAYKEKGYAEQEPQLEKKIEHLLKGMHFIDSALFISSSVPEVSHLKLELSQKLLKYACETQNFQFASYFVKGVEHLAFVKPSKKEQLKTEFEFAKTAILREQQKTLKYWKSALTDPLLGMKEEAILAINKMQNFEILQEIAEEVKKGTEYFLKEKQRTVKQDEYYEMMALALGSLENPKAGSILWECLEKISSQVLQFKEGYRPYADLQFMITLTQALGHAKAVGFSEKLITLRKQMGNSLYTESSQRTLGKLILLDQSIDHFKPTSATDFLERAKLRDEVKDVTNALLDYSEAIRLDPNFARAYLNRGLLKQRQGKIEEAILDFTEVIRLHPTFAEAYSNRGNTKSELGDFVGAISDFDEAIRLNPQSDIYSNRGSVKVKQKRYEEAILDFSEAIRLNPQNVNAYNNRGNAKRDLGDFNGALQDYDMAIRLNPRAEIYNNRGTVTFEQKKYREAIVDFSEAIRHNPQHPEAYNNRANAKRELGDLNGAIRDYDEVIRLNPKDENAYGNRANVKADLGNFKEALLDYDKAIQLTPQNPIVYNHRGNVKRELKEFENAIQDYKKAIQLDAKYAEAYANLGLLYHSSYNLKSALFYFDEAIRLNPNLIEAYYNRALIKMAQKDFSSAILDFTEVIRLNPQDAEAYYNIGVLKKAMNAHTEAVVFLEKSLALKEEAKARNALINFLKDQLREQWKQKQWDDAKITLLKLKKWLSTDDPLQKQLAEKLQQLEKIIQTTEKK